MEKKGDDIIFVATDETVDRHNESIPMDSWDLENYLAAPRLLVDHDHRVEKIVGRAADITMTGKRMTFRPEFHDITQLAREVKQMVLDGHLNTVSVGFIPHPPEKGKEYGINELVEISFVTVPANPSAQRVKSLLDEAEKDEEKQLVEKFFVVEEKELEGTMSFKSTEVQVLVFSKEKFETVASAKKWATDHSFLEKEVEEKDSTIRIKQFESDKCVEGSERTIQLEEGVKAIVCRNDDTKCAKVETVDAPAIVEDDTSGKQNQTPTDESVVSRKSKLTKEERHKKIVRTTLRQVAHIVNQGLMQLNKDQLL